MGDNSKISWTDASWNPVTGCSRVSPGCENCYAEALSLRFGWTKLPWSKANASANVVCHEDRLSLPIRWRRPRRVFVNSMSDLFADEVPDFFVLRVFGAMAAAPQHSFQVLTKRPARMARMLSSWSRLEVSDVARSLLSFVPHAESVYEAARNVSWPLPNVWLGTSVEDQRRADERIPHLLQTPAAVRFLSCEPLLGPIDIGLLGTMPESISKRYALVCERIQWVIVGGESGRGYRPMDERWAISIRDECRNAGVAFFFKQSAGPKPETMPHLPGADGARYRWHQYPGEISAPEKVV